ncbi:hypothetical protein ANAPH2_00390 [Anaplasma phagocytophilum]|nr:hypothetical protein ANAPH2_00390 [Anaplasma phagocytophilum]
MMLLLDRLISLLPLLLRPPVKILSNLRMPLKFLALSSMGRFVVNSMRRLPLTGRRQHTFQTPERRTHIPRSVVALGLVEQRLGMGL